jgi:hypothetical protein
MAMSRVLRSATLSLVCLLGLSAAWARYGDREYDVWRLRPPTTAASVLRPGGDRVDEVKADADGGFVRITSFGGGNCRGQIQRFEFWWKFDRNVSVIAGKRDTQVFGVTRGIRGDNNPCMDLNPYFRINLVGDLLTVNVGGEGRFYFKPSIAHDPQPRAYSIFQTNRTEEGIRIDIPHACAPEGSACWLYIDYLYDGVADDTGQAAFCAAYSDRAVRQNGENTRRSCGFSGPRWHGDYAAHNEWCLATLRATVDTENKARDAELARCGQGQQVLGGVDIARHCGEIFGSASPRLVENTANGWRCAVGSRLVSISIEEACRRQYHDPRAVARPRDFNDPNSWECVAP